MGNTGGTRPLRSLTVEPLLFSNIEATQHNTKLPSFSGDAEVPIPRVVMFRTLRKPRALFVVLFGVKTRTSSNDGFGFTRRSFDKPGR